MACIDNKDSVFRSLLIKSGISETKLKYFVQGWRSRNSNDSGFPQLWEIPGADSSKALKEFLKLDKDNSTSLDALKDIYGDQTLTDKDVHSKIKQNLNKEYNDKIIDIVTADKNSDNPGYTILIKPRPKNKHIDADFAPITTLDSNFIFDHLIPTFLAKYGTYIYAVTPDLIARLGIKDNPTAFILRGNIYLNQEAFNEENVARKGLIHELFHILLGNYRAIKGDNYAKLVGVVEQLSNYDALVLSFSDTNVRTRNDINEELFVRELSNMFTEKSQNGEFAEKLGLKNVNEITEYLFEALDTLFDGNKDVKSIMQHEGINIFQLPLLYLANAVLANALVNKTKGSITSKAMLSRKISDAKTKMISGQHKLGWTLEEHCI